jgi:hypothetical protein
MNILLRGNAMEKSKKQAEINNNSHPHAKILKLGSAIMLTLGGNGDGYEGMQHFRARPIYK